MKKGSMHKPFRDLAIGEEFSFCECGLPLAHGLYRADFMKISPRKYTDGRYDYTVGTVGVKTIPLNMAQTLCKLGLDMDKEVEG